MLGDLWVLVETFEEFEVLTSIAVWSLRWSDAALRWVRGAVCRGGCPVTGSRARWRRRLHGGPRLVPLRMPWGWGRHLTLHTTHSQHEYRQR